MRFQDEVHDRDQHTDFLLLVLRELMPQYPNLKLVLMSANVNVDLFSKYFNVHGAQILEGITFRFVKISGQLSTCIFI